MERILDDGSFCKAVRELEPTAFAVAWLLLRNNADCEDAMSAAVLRAYEKRSGLKNADSFRAWFLRILKNEAYNVLRHRSRLVPLETLASEAASQAPDPVLAEALLKLPEQQRIAVVLQAKGYSQSEIAHILRIPEGTVKSRLSRAKASLQSELKGEE